MFFLVQAETELPPAMTVDERTDLDAREYAVGEGFAVERKLVHIWRVPGRRANVAIWSCADADDLHRTLSALPAWPWMDVRVQPLAGHPLSAIAESGALGHDAG